MSGDFFCKVFDASDVAMDYDYEEPYKMDDLKSFTFKAKGAPRTGLSYSHSGDLAWKKTDWSVGHKSELTNHCDKCNTTVNWKNSLKDVEWKIAHKPEALNKDGKIAWLNLEGKCEPKEQKGEVSVKGLFGGIKIGPLYSWTTLQVQRASATVADKKTEDWTAELTQNFNYEKNVNVGFRCDLNLQKKQLDAAYGHLAYTHADYGTWYFRSNCLSRFVGLGVHKKGGDTRFHVAEVQYDFSKDKKQGLFGQPLFLRFAGDYKLSDGTTWNWRANWGQ